MQQTSHKKLLTKTHPNKKIVLENRVGNQSSEEDLEHSIFENTFTIKTILIINKYLLYLN